MTPGPRVKVLHTAAPGLVSRAIRAVTRSEVSHSALSFWSTDYGLEYIVEAESRGVVGKPAVRRRAYLEQSLHSVHALELPAAELGALLHQVASASKGQPYDWMLNLQLLFVLLGNRAAGRRRWAPRWARGERYNCSETIASALATVGLLQVSPQATPGELWQALEEWPWARRIPAEKYLAQLRWEEASAARRSGRMRPGPADVQGVELQLDLVDRERV